MRDPRYHTDFHTETPIWSKVCGIDSTPSRIVERFFLNFPDILFLMDLSGSRGFCVWSSGQDKSFLVTATTSVRPNVPEAITPTICETFNFGSPSWTSSGPQDSLFNRFGTSGFNLQQARIDHEILDILTNLSTSLADKSGKRNIKVKLLFCLLFDQEWSD